VQCSKPPLRSVDVGNGTRTWFWRAKWLDGSSIECFAPDLFAVVDKRAVRVRTFAQGMQRESWIADITGSLSVLGLYQYATLWAQLQTLTLDAAAADKFSWKWTVDKQYTASSAYRAFFVGQASILGAIETHETTAPPTSKFLVWLALLGRC
jgi:hypothetical protein